MLISIPSYLECWLILLSQKEYMSDSPFICIWFLQFSSLEHWAKRPHLLIRQEHFGQLKLTWYLLLCQLHLDFQAITHIFISCNHEWIGNHTLIRRTGQIRFTLPKHMKLPNYMYILCLLSLLGHLNIIIMMKIISKLKTDVLKPWKRRT